jgi:putative protein-disulfide isomerase
MHLTLYYFHDPMCSWCWAFRPLWTEIVTGLPDYVKSQRVLGGLAPDTDQPMPTDMQVKLQSTWLKIQQTVPGTPFNFEFWEKCTPRRSTYAACRTVIAARRQGQKYEEVMILAIQQAYYLEARNPAERSILLELANEIGLDGSLFSRDLESPTVHEALLKEIELTRSMEIKGFPTLLLKKAGVLTVIQHNYNDVGAVLDQVKRLSH